MTIESTPVLSRRTIRGDMAARGLRPAADLAANKPCGTRLRYYAGCRCFQCRMANSAYEAERKAARARGEGNGLVSADRAREHLAYLSDNGVGMKTAADAAKVPPSSIAKIIYCQRLNIRAQTERRILAVTTATRADGAFVDAGPTWVLINELLASGYSKVRIASELAGKPVKALQLRGEQITVRNAGVARLVYDRLRLVSATELRQAERQLAELREECFRMDHIQRDVDKLAAARGWTSQPIICERKGGRWPSPARLTQRTVLLIDAVHACLVGGGE